MRCFKSTRGYVNRFCRDKGRSRPRSTWYWVEYEDGRYERLLHAPKSYRKVKKVVFCVDDEGFAERFLRLWIEQPTVRGRRWLVEREAKRVLDSLLVRGVSYLPYNVNNEVHNKLESYLSEAKQAHRQEFDRKVLETACEAMSKAGEFALLNHYGDSLSNPPQW